MCDWNKSNGLLSDNERRLLEIATELMATDADGREYIYEDKQN